MNWWVDYKLWGNSDVLKPRYTKTERLQRTRNAVIIIAGNREHQVIFVDFEEEHVQKKLPPPG